MNTITLDKLYLPAGAVADGENDAGSHVWGMTLNLERGKRYRLKAASGSGKSSICDFIFGNRIDYGGRILFDGADSRRLNATQWTSLRRTSLAYMPQETALFKGLTVMENIAVKNRLTDSRSRQWIADALEALDVADKARWPIERLSVGQRQRVAAIRALCQPFDFLLLDEPVSHLDPERAALLARLIDATAQEEGAAVVFTTVGADLPLEALELRL